MKQLTDKYGFYKELKTYNNTQHLETKYDQEQPITKNTKELGKYIHDNYNKMDDLEMKQIVLKCMDNNDIRNILLTYEFTHYDEKYTHMDLDKFQQKTIQYFNKYQNKAGGNLIEDDTWIIHKSDSPYFDVKSNQVVFQNTIDKMDVNDFVTNAYLNRMIEKLNKLSTNIIVELEYKEKKKLTYVVIWATDCTIIDDDVVGL